MPAFDRQLALAEGGGGGEAVTRTVREEKRMWGEGDAKGGGGGLDHSRGAA
jgi:hypothetical protein